MSFEHIDDQHLDANLRALGPTISLPPAPDAARLASWKAVDAGAGPSPAGVEDTHAFSGRVRRLRPRRRWLAAFSGVAAAVAAGSAILFTVTRGSQVSANTILESLRHASVEGVRITLTGVQADNASVDGQIAVRLTRPINIEALLDGQANFDGGVREAYAQMDVRLGEAGPVSGLSVHVEGALSEPSSWVFVSSNDVPGQLAQGNPIATMLANMMRGGLIVDFGAGATERLMHQLEHEADDGDNDAPPIEIRFEQQVEGPAHADGAGAPINGVDEIPPAIRGLLTGQAGQQELEEVGRMLRDGTPGSTIQEQPGGRFVLTVRPPDGQAGASATLRIGYLQGAGVEWVEITDLGNFAGAVRLELLTSPIDPTLLQKDRLVVPGRTITVTEELLRSLMGE